MADTTGDRWQRKREELMHSGNTLLGLALGNDLGLIRAMGELDRPVTAAELAEKTDCKERYVREWLLHMTMAETLEMDESSTRFSLPEGSLNGLISMSQSASMIPILASVHGDLTKAFKSSGPRGIPDEAGRTLLHFLEPDKMPLWEQQCPVLLKAIGGLYSKLENGCEIMDIGCHNGNFCLTLAPQFPLSTFYGVDPYGPVIAEAREKASSRAICNVRFEAENAARLPEDWSVKFDAVFMFNTFHDIPNASIACEETKRVLKPGGYCIIRDMNIPSDPAEQKKMHTRACELYTYSLYHCLPLSMNTPNSEALGTAAGLQRIVQMFCKTGFKHIPESELSLPDDNKHILVFLKE